MAAIKSILNIFLIVISVCRIVFCLYEDQVGKFDWKQSYVGKIKYASFDSVKKLVVATEENVIASLYLKNGQIGWRQVLEDPNNNQIELLHVDKEAVVVSGNSNMWYVRGWDLNSGMLIWEWTVHLERNMKGYWLTSENQLIHVLPVVESHLEVTIYQMQTGENSGSSSKISTPWVKDLSKCVLAGTYWTCLLDSSSSKGQIYYINLLDMQGRVYTRSLQSLIGETTGEVVILPFKHSEPAFLLVRNNVARLILLRPEALEVLPHGLLPNVIEAHNGDQKLLLQLETNQEDPKTLVIKSIDLHEGTETIFMTEYIENLYGPKPMAAICRGSACRILFYTDDNAVSLLQMPSGKILWTRQEALSHIVATEFLELPVSDLDASIEHEFDFASGDILGMLYRRLLSQARQLSVLLSGSQGSFTDGLVRDEFGLHKIIVVATSVGKIFAIDTFTGDVIWATYLPNINPYSMLDKPKMLLFVQRTARYPPLKAQCVLLAKDSTNGNGIIYTFEPITGQSLHLEKLPNRIKQAMLLPYEDETHLKALVVLTENNNIYVYPSNAKSMLYKHAQSLYMFSANSKLATLDGYNLIHSTLDTPKVSSTWKLSLGSARLVALSTRPITERVHSQGRVLADRSVLYKYINPNLLALATLADDPLHKHVLSIYLIDGVSGLVVYSTTHRRAKGPVHLVHSENWLLYSYFNEKFRRIELASVELYEGAMQSNSTVFSSHAVSQLPHAETQAYILPATPLAMQVTLTERGITSKHMLVALSNGAVIEIPWAFLEPRGALTPSGPEEGFVPYLPELPLPAEATINYNHSLANVRAVQVAPARLESTCLVLIHGLDIFYTRVTPSKTFDLLKEDFDHWLIATVLIGLIVSSYITKRLASRKALKQAWK